MAGRITAWRWQNPRWTPADHSGVVIPLEQAHLHSHSARCGRAEYEEVPDQDRVGHEDEEGEGDADDENDPKARGVGVRGEGEGDEGTGMLPMSAAEYSIEGLRKEVRRGGGGTRSEYESEFCAGPFPLMARVMGMGRVLRLLTSSCQ